jgi:thioredoxin-related protein
MGARYPTLKKSQEKTSVILGVFIHSAHTDSRLAILNGRTIIFCMNSTIFSKAVVVLVCSLIAAPTVFCQTTNQENLPSSVPIKGSRPAPLKEKKAASKPKTTTSSKTKASTKSNATKTEAKPAPAPVVSSKPAKAPVAVEIPHDQLWLTNYEQALKKAKAEKKFLLMNITGSDWCIWCVKIEQEIFSKIEFQQYAKKNLVLLEIDFPHGKEQSEALQAQNQKLAEEFNPFGIFPTILVFNSDGKNIAQLGYTPDGPSGFIAKLEELKK